MPRRVTDALASGGDLPSLLAKLRDFESKQTALLDELAANRPVPMPPRSVIEDRLAEWRRLLRQSAKTGRVVLDHVPSGRIVFTPVWSHVKTPGLVRIRLPDALRPLFSGVVIPKWMWEMPVPGAGDLRPEHVYYRAEDRSVDLVKSFAGCSSGGALRRFRPQAESRCLDLRRARQNLSGCCVSLGDLRGATMFSWT